ncbi:MAG: IS200/IS605 family transposase [Bacteroidales bacterium]|nr:IS200/IS605 family transposase [Candidatus Sodaliphilus fimicaballi]
MSYSQLLYHIIFRTKNSKKAINQVNERLMYHYIYTQSENMGCTIYRIGGMEEHIHILVSIPPSICIADYVKQIKVSSSKRFCHSKEFPEFGSWATGYAALTYTYRDKDIIIRYIMSQKDHHKVFSFRDEYLKLLEESGIKVDQKYFLQEE